MKTLTGLRMQDTFRKLQFITPRKEVPVLMYHQIAHVSKEEDPLGLAVPPEVFEKQMKLLTEAGFESISLDDLEDIEETTRNDLRKVFALTFDDGYLDNFTNALSILLKYRIKSTIFLVSDYVGNTRQCFPGLPASLMNWEQAREMSRYGISIQSHSCTHRDLTKLDNKRALRELADSRKKIEDNLDLPVRHFAYPYGKYDKRIMNLVKESAYQSAFADRLGDRSRFSRSRVVCYAFDSDWKFRLVTCKWGSWLSQIRNLSRDFSSLIRVLKLLDAFLTS